MMRLHLRADCIMIYVDESSSHYSRVSQILLQQFSRSLWVNETLINFCKQHEIQKREELLRSLYYTCAFVSKTSDVSFLKKLILASEKPIKMVKAQRKAPFPLPQIRHNPYRLLNAHEGESLQSIRKKYLRLAKQFHPDSTASNDQIKIKDLTAKFQQIQEAYATIKIEKTKNIAA